MTGATRHRVVIPAKWKWCLAAGMATLWHVRAARRFAGGAATRRGFYIPHLGGVEQGGRQGERQGMGHPWRAARRRALSLPMAP